MEPIKSAHYLRALATMREATTVPKDRRRASRRQDSRRENRSDSAIAPDLEKRRSYRRSQFDRRGIIASFMTHQAPDDVFNFLSNFDHWSVSGKATILIRESILNKQLRCLRWDSKLDDFPIQWRSMTRTHKETRTLVFEFLDGDLDVFSGRVWVEAVGSSSRANFNIVANFDLGAFERLLGPIFKEKFEALFVELVHSLQRKLKGDHEI